MLSDKWYNRLKITAQYLLPGMATLYFALAEIWKLPARAEIVATITALDTFLGVILGISSKNFKEADPKIAGDIEISDAGDGRRSFLLVLKDEKVAETIDQYEFGTFKIITK